MIIAGMGITPLSLWSARASALVLAALLGLSVAYWTLRWPAAANADGVSEVAQAANSRERTPDLRALQTLLGARTDDALAGNASASDVHYRLTGVVAERGGSGAALIATDGKPARAVRVGQRVDEHWMLQSVDRRRAVLATDANAAPSLTLELAAPKD